MGAAPPALSILYIFCTRILCRCCSSFTHLRRMMGSRRRRSIRGILLFNTYQIPSIRRKTRNNSIIPVTVPTLRVYRKRAQVVVCGGRQKAKTGGGGQLQLQSLWLFTKESSNGIHCQGSRRNSKERERDAASDDGWCEWKEQSGYL